MKRIFMFLALASICLVSCKKVNMGHGQDLSTGSLMLNVSSVGDYVTVESKSGGDAIDFTDIETYDVLIEGPVKISKKFSEFVGQVTELGSGDYTITVTSPYTEPAAFEQPIYRAVESFTIKAGEVTSLDLECTPYNCKVTIELTDNFVKELATYEVTITNGLGELVWTKNSQHNDFTSGKAGYFLPRGLDIRVKGFRSIDNSEATAQYYIENPQPADHHIIKLDAKVTGSIGGGENGQPGISISVSTTFNEVNQDIEVDGFEEDTYVDRPDFGDGTEEEEENLKNEIIWAANPTFEPYTVNPSSEVAMTIKMPAGISSFVVETTHTGFNGALSIMTNGGVDYIDLINDTVFAEKMRGGDSPIDPNHNLPLGNELTGKTEVEFNLTCFISLLCNVVPNETVPFILKAYDTNGTPLLFMGDFPTITLVVTTAATAQ